MPEQAGPIRIQEYAVGIFQAALTRSAWKKAIKKGFVRVDGELASTATYIRGGEQITLEIPPKQEPEHKFVLSLPVIFEDEYLAAIYKPAGVLVSGNSFKTIANALEQNIAASQLEDATKPQPVHRLDFGTTGILLVGKTSRSIRELNQLFENKLFEKTYHAVVIGKIAERGTITADIDGKSAVSHFRMLQSVASPKFEQLSLLELQLGTGRRHQLRKHLAGIGNPILGDQTYGVEGKILQKKGLYLHASSLRFIHPFTKEPMHLKAVLPGRFTKLFPAIS